MGASHVRILMLMALCAVWMPPSRQASAQPVPQIVQAETTCAPLIPRDWFFRSARCVQATLSPDGTAVALVVQTDTGAELRVASTRAPSDIRTLRSAGANVLECSWPALSDRLVILRRVGEGRSELALIDPVRDKDEVVGLNSRAPVSIIAPLPTRPGVAAVRLAGANPATHAVVLVDAIDGSIKPVADIPANAASLVIAPDGGSLAVLVPSADDRPILRRFSSGRWEELALDGADSSVEIRLVALERAVAAVGMVTLRRDGSWIVQETLPSETGLRTVAETGPGPEPVVALDPVRGRIVGVLGAGNLWEPPSPVLQRAIEGVGALRRGPIATLATNLDGRVCLVRLMGASFPPALVVIDATSPDRPPVVIHSELPMLETASFSPELADNSPVVVVAGTPENGPGAWAIRRFLNSRGYRVNDVGSAGPAFENGNPEWATDLRASLRRIVDSKTPCGVLALGSACEPTVRVLSEFHDTVNAVALIEPGNMSDWRFLSRSPAWNETQLLVLQMLTSTTGAEKRPNAPRTVESDPAGWTAIAIPEVATDGSFNLGVAMSETEGFFAATLGGRCQARPPLGADRLEGVKPGPREAENLR